MEADDARKKRVSDHVVGPVAVSKEKLKKLKGGGERSKGAAVEEEHRSHTRGAAAGRTDEAGNNNNNNNNNERPPSPCRHEGEPDDAATKSSKGGGGGGGGGDLSSSSSRSSSSRSLSSRSGPVGTCCDLESALQRVARMGSSSSDDPAARERASSNEGGDGSWIKYRVAHSGDASTLAGCYRKLKGGGLEPPKENAPLEVWLAEGLGDEDEPPFVFALLAEVCSERGPVRVGSAALLTQTWSDGKRYIRVEWTYSENDHLERSLWLRLASLGLLSSCELLVGEAARCETKSPRA